MVEHVTQAPEWIVFVDHITDAREIQLAHMVCCGKKNMTIDSASMRSVSSDGSVNAFEVEYDNMLHSLKI